MPRWPHKPDSDEKINIAITAWNLGYYKSKEACAKAHNVDPNTFCRKIDQKQQSYKVTHNNQQCILSSGKGAIVQHCIYLAKDGFPCQINTI